MQRRRRVTWISLLYIIPDPLTLEILATISLAEYGRLRNEQRREASAVTSARSKSIHEKNDDEESDVALQPFGTDALVSIVGYRETPAYFRKSLECYINAHGCRFMLTVIDGKHHIATVRRLLG